MKTRTFTVLLLTALLSATGMAQNKVLKSFLSYTTYNIPGSTPYVENALAFDQGSVVYKQIAPGQYRAKVEITTIFKQGEKVCNFSKVALDSPVVNDTVNLDGAFIDQQRFSLPNGEYQMEINVMDMNNEKRTPYSVGQTVVVNYQKDVPAVSDILLIDSYAKAVKASACTKSGLDLVPRVYSYYPAKVSKLTFYSELYNTNKLYDKGQYLVNYYITSYESSVRMSGFNGMKRLDVGPVGVMLSNVDITNLPSGNYYLVVEMRDRSNELIASNSVFFQRSNPGVEYDVIDLNAVTLQNSFATKITNLDTIREYLRSLDPISSEVERNYIVGLTKSDDLETMQRFLNNFWNARHPMNPAQGWEDYKAAVKRVNMSFSTKALKGYRTDLGYVFLKYGQPDKIVEVPSEPGAYPYQIWHYYVLDNQRNKRFVFLAKDNVTNDYHLIHSDAIGEINNPRWQLEVYSRVNVSGYDIDRTKWDNTWGTHAGELYENPR
ncbi:MAG: GWxTD domain-containing protein [Candidatus Limimorpha sp.]